MQPLAQFEVVPWIPIHVFGLDLSLTNVAAFMFLAVVLTVVFLFVGLRRQQFMPDRWQCLAEVPLHLVDDMLLETNGQKGQSFLPLMASVFLFIFMGNFLGLLPYAFTFTSQLIVNFALAVGVILIIMGIGIVRHGLSFFRIFFPSGIPLWICPFLIPIEILSYLSRPLSLAIRLTANMMAGHSMLKIFAYFTIMAGVLGVIPLCVNIVLIAFECLVAFLQAYVFTMLSCIYLHDALELH